MKEEFTRKNKIHILLHLLAWGILLFIPIYLMNRWQVDKDFLWLYYFNIITSGLIFYINYLFLVPKLFFQTRKVKYIVSVVVLIACLYCVSDNSIKFVFRSIQDRSNTERIRGPEPGDRQKKQPPDRGTMSGRPPFREMHLFNFTFNALFIVFFSLGLKILERHSRIEKRQKEMEKERLNSELAFLKNQISPHFFFNTLNNIYSLININTDNSKEAILKLSRLMRYLLYESEQGKVRLDSEIDFMNNYIDLMKLRMSEKVSLNTSFPDKYDNILIPPLLFIPFIENAFKHGISYRQRSFINIQMEMKSDSITFICSNSLGNFESETERNHVGIGLENVKKRLSLLFPQKHTLSISKTEKTFEVFLNISVND